MRILGKMHSLTLTFMSLLGELRLEQTRLDAAVGFLVPALESQRKVLGRRCPIHVAVLNTLSRLGNYTVLCTLWQLWCCYRKHSSKSRNTTDSPR